MTAANPSSGHAGQDRARETGPALHAHYRFILWLVPEKLRFLFRLAWEFHAS